MLTSRGGVVLLTLAPIMLPVVVAWDTIRLPGIVIDGKTLKLIHKVATGPAMEETFIKNRRFNKASRIISKAIKRAEMNAAYEAEVAVRNEEIRKSYEDFKSAAESNK